MKIKPKRPCRANKTKGPINSVSHTKKDQSRGHIPGQKKIKTKILNLTKYHKTKGQT